MTHSLRKLWRIWAAATLAAATGSCNSTGCLDNGSALPLAGFYSSTTGSTISVDSLEIHGVGAPGDSVLLPAQTGVSKVYLPFNPATTQVRWCIAYRQQGLDSPANNDTLTFAYEPMTYFASNDCGAMYIYRITSATTTRHLIDSVMVTDSLVTNVELERIRIYFRTAEEEGRR